METLTLEQISQLQQSPTQRGVYKRTILEQQADHSVLAQNVMALARFAEVDPTAVYNSFNLRIEKLTESGELTDRFLCINDTKEGKVVLMNQTAIDAALAALNADEDGE